MAQFNTSNIATGASTGAMMGGPVGAAVGAGAGLLLSGLQYGQAKRQAEEDERNRPLYQMPAEVRAGLNMAEHQALEGLPEAQKQSYLSDINRTAAYSIGQLRNRKGGLAGIPQVQANLDKGKFDLMGADASARMQRQQQVYGQLANVANYKDQQYQLNQLNPYYEGIARRNANTGALYQNLSNASQLGMYAFQGVGGQPKQAAQTANYAPQGTSMGFNTAGQPISVAPGVNANQAVNMNTNNFQNAFPQGNMLGSVGQPINQLSLPAMPIGNYAASPYVPFQQ
jgi:hypothetical protein